MFRLVLVLLVLLVILRATYTVPQAVLVHILTIMSSLATSHLHIREIQSTINRKGA